MWDLLSFQYFSGWWRRLLQSNGKPRLMQLAYGLHMCLCQGGMIWLSPKPCILKSTLSQEISFKNMLSCQLSTQDKEALIFENLGKQNQANKKHKVRVKSYFGMNWWEMHTLLLQSDQFIWNRFTSTENRRAVPDCCIKMRHLFTPRFSVTHTYSTAFFLKMHLLLYLCVWPEGKSLQI